MMMVTLDQILGKAVYISLSATTFGKGKVFSFQIEKTSRAD